MITGVIKTYGVYRNDSIPAIEAHCLSDCRQSPLFQELKEAHDAREGLGGAATDISKERSIEERLANEGIPVSEDEIEAMEWWATLDDEKLLQLVDECDVSALHLETKASI